MRVRLTGLGEEDIAVDGATPGPPEIGKPFSVLVMSLEKLVVTGNVSHVGLDRFRTEDGTYYIWARRVGEA